MLNLKDWLCSPKASDYLFKDVNALPFCKLRKVRQCRIIWIVEMAIFAALKELFKDIILHPFTKKKIKVFRKYKGIRYFL